MNQTFEEQQTGIYVTLQSLMHQIEAIEKQRNYKFKFKVETEKFYKVIEPICEGFTKRFDLSKDTTDSFVEIVSQIDALAKSIKIVKPTK